MDEVGVRLPVGPLDSVESKSGRSIVVVYTLRVREVRVRFSAPRQFIYFIECSSDLATWLRIGVASRTATGDFEFEDKTASAEGKRFYRVVVQ